MEPDRRAGGQAAQAWGQHCTAGSNRAWACRQTRPVARVLAAVLMQSPKPRVAEPRPLASVARFSEHLSGLKWALCGGRGVGGGQRDDSGLGPASQGPPPVWCGEPSKPRSYSSCGGCYERGESRGLWKPRPLTHPRDLRGGWKQGRLPGRGDTQAEPQIAGRQPSVPVP